MERLKNMDGVNIGDLLIWVTKDVVKRKLGVCAIVKEIKIKQDIYEGEWIETKRLITEQKYRTELSKTFNPKVKDSINVFRLSEKQKENYKLMITAEEL